MSSESPLLQTESLTKRYGSFEAVSELSVSFYDDELCAIIGPNGAGKTTLFNLITGETSASAGQIVFNDTDITDEKPHKIAQEGLIRSFQITNVFTELSVFENLQVALLSNRNPFNMWGNVDNMDGINDRCTEILERVDLAEQRDKMASNLGHGDQRMLEIAVALGKDPDMLLLDEPSSGMSSAETAEMVDIISDLAEDIPIVLVEHKMSLVKSVADRLIVLHNGQLLAEGDPSTVRNNEDVQRVYLNSSAE
jgi:branched-chain amino acid transport system ATP-binding protein